jgi:hypothetical protein
MTRSSPNTKRSHRETWSRERLLRERAVAIACSIEPGSISSYSSAVKSYFSFCSAHSLPFDPNPDTLSFYAVYMAHHIKPKSVGSYLSGICNQLEPFFPEVRSNRRHWLVTKTLAGCRKMLPSAVSRKRPVARSELATIARSYQNHPISFDDTLFLAILMTGFHGLMRLGELTWPDNKKLRDYRKVIMRNSVLINPHSFQFTLPGHKADRLFEGNLILIQSTNLDDDACKPFKEYLSLRDRFFPLRAELWLRRNGTIPTRAWFLRILHHHLSGNIGGQSLRAGGATALAEAGIPPHMVQAVGRWTSEGFQLYVRRHPVLLAAFLYGSRNTQLAR